jgi:hypothetical protein
MGINLGDMSETTVVWWRWVEAVRGAGVSSIHHRISRT